MIRKVADLKGKQPENFTRLQNFFGLQDRVRNATLLRSESFIYHFFIFVKRLKADIFFKTPS